MHEFCLEITVDQYHHRNCFTLDFFDSFILVHFSLFFVNVFSTGVIEAIVLKEAKVLVSFLLTSRVVFASSLPKRRKE